MHGTAEAAWRKPAKARMQAPRFRRHPADAVLPKGDGDTDGQESLWGQETFVDVNSRTYMSSLERDPKSPTLRLQTELCEVMEVHPLTRRL